MPRQIVFTSKAAKPPALLYEESADVTISWWRIAQIIRFLEWFGGHDPDKDDVLVGNFKSFGFHTFMYNNDEDRTSRLYVEEYGLTKEGRVGFSEGSIVQ